MKQRFTRLDEASRAGLGRLVAKRPSGSLLAQRWPELVGPYLAEKIEPRLGSGGRLEVVVKDPRCRRAVEGLLPQLEEKMRAAFPNITSVSLKS